MDFLAAMFHLRYSVLAVVAIRFSAVRASLFILGVAVIPEGSFFHLFDFELLVFGTAGSPTCSCLFSGTPQVGTLRPVNRTLAFVAKLASHAELWVLASAF